MSTPSSEIQAVVAEFADAWNRHDMMAFAALFAPDAEFVTVSGNWLRGQAEIRATHEGMHASVMKTSRLDVSEVSVRFAGPEVAIARARWRLEGLVDRDGTVLPPRVGVFVNLVARQARAWRILDTQNTEIANRA